MSKTVVLGASPDYSRYSYKCVKSLIRHGHEAVPVGKKEGKIEGIDILTGKPQVPDVHTIAIYLSPDNQKEYYDYIFALNPSRIILNPGTYNQELIDLAKDKGIEVVSDCALILLSSDMF
jgi:predicted CoA-binding protein